MTKVQQMGIWKTLMDITKMQQMANLFGKPWVVPQWA